MPLPSSIKPVSRAPRWRQASLVVGAVGLVHWVALCAAPLQFGPPAPASTATMVFDTRWVPQEPDPRTSERVVPPQRPHAPQRIPPRPATPAASVQEPAPEGNGPLAMPPVPQQLAAATPEPQPAAGRTVAPSTLAAARTPRLPQSVRLLYDIKGETKRIPVSAQGELLWRQDGSTYDARLEIRIFLLGSRVQTSKGLIGAQGLEPVRFGDKVRSEVAAHFERGKGKVSYSANTPDEPLQPGAQDQLSIFFQLAGLFAADPERYPPGSTLSFQAVGPRSSEVWTFKVSPPEQITLPGGLVRAVRLGKDPVGEYDSRAEVWLAPELEYLPVRIRLTQSNGDMVDQQWRATERPAAESLKP